MRHSFSLAFFAAYAACSQFVLASDAKPVAREAARADAGAAAAKAGPSPGPADTVDQKRVHAEYGDGNFDAVVQILEDYRARHGSYRAVDSVIIAKYLGVVYAANP